MRDRRPLLAGLLTSVLVWSVLIGGSLIGPAPLRYVAAQPHTTGVETAQTSGSMVEDIHKLVQGVGYEVLIVAQKWGLVPSFCMGFKAALDRTFDSNDAYITAFEQAQDRLGETYAWYSPWGNVQSLILSTLYYFGWKSNLFSAELGLTLSKIEFYLLPLPSIYLTMTPKEEELADSHTDPSILYIYLAELGYEVVKVAESVSWTGPEVTFIFRTTDKADVVREWAWAKIDNYMANYPETWSVTYVVLSAFLYLLRQADDTRRYFGNEPSVDLDYVGISVGLLPYILNRFSVAGEDPAMFARDPCQ